MKYALIGILAILLLAPKASAQLPESDHERGQTTGEQTLMVLHQRATNFQAITGSCEKASAGKECLALLKLDAWDKCSISIFTNHTIYHCVWSDKNQDHIFAFYAAVAINLHDAAKLEYKDYQLTFPPATITDSESVVGVICIKDGEYVVADLGLLREADGQMSVGLWILSAPKVQ